MTDRAPVAADRVALAAQPELRLGPPGWHDQPAGSDERQS